MRRHISGLALALVAPLAVLAWRARADQPSGTWTGNVETRGNYYWERSTRVVAPSIHADVTSPDGVVLTADYLIDTITSASIASGVNADIRFTELRNDVATGVGYELDLGNDAHLRLVGRAHLSIEPDYHSYGGTATGQLSLNRRATVFTLVLGGNHDFVGKIFRGGAPMVDPVTGRSLSDRGIVGELDVGSVSLSWSQLLTPTMELECGYDFGLLEGFQANAYRMVVVGGAGKPEVHPTERARHAIYGRFAWYLPATHTSLHALYRAYLDDWRIAAINPELRVYQELTHEFQLRLRYRYYAQTAAFFYKPQTDYLGADALVTADPKMSAFENHTIGAQLVLSLSFLQGSFLDFATQGTLEFSFDYIFNTNRYGNGVISQVGLRVPF